MRNLAALSAMATPRGACVWLNQLHGEEPRALCSHVQSLEFCEVQHMRGQKRLNFTLFIHVEQVEFRPTFGEYHAQTGVRQTRPVT